MWGLGKSSFDYARISAVCAESNDSGESCPTITVTFVWPVHPIIRRLLSESSRRGKRMTGEVEQKSGAPGTSPTMLWRGVPPKRRS